MRWAVSIAILGVLSLSAYADPLTYEVVTDTPGIFIGSTIVGTIVVPDSLLGGGNLLIANALSFDLHVVGYAPSGAGWVSTDPLVSVGGEVLFAGVLGDPILRPLIGPQGGEWGFHNGEQGAVPHTLRLAYSNTGGIGWQWFMDQGGEFALHTSQAATAWHLSLRTATDTSPVPEPGTLALLAGGLASLIRFARRPRSSAAAGTAH